MSGRIEIKKEDEKILDKIKKSKNIIKKCEEILNKLNYLENKLRNDDSCSLAVKKQLDEILEFFRKNGIEFDDSMRIQKNKLH